LRASTVSVPGCQHAPCWSKWGGSRCWRRWLWSRWR